MSARSCIGFTSHRQAGRFPASVPSHCLDEGKQQICFNKWQEMCCECQLRTVVSYEKCKLAWTAVAAAGSDMGEPSSEKIFLTTRPV